VICALVEDRAWCRAVEPWSSLVSSRRALVEPGVELRNGAVSSCGMVHQASGESSGQVSYVTCSIALEYVVDCAGQESGQALPKFGRAALQTADRVGFNPRRRQK
jgi:hypothetical protein